VERLCEELPEGYFVVPNLEVADPRGGQLVEFDVVVVAPHAVYAVEVKDLRGEIVGDEREWVVDGRSRRSPLAVTERKARILKSRLVDRAPGLERVRVEAIVVLYRRPVLLELDEVIAPRVVLLEGAADLISDVDVFGRSLEANEQLAAEVMNALGVIGHARPEGRVVLGDYECVELLDQTEDEAVYRARHRFMKALPEAVLRVVSLSPYTDPDELGRRRDQLFRESEALLRMGAHPNVVGARTVFDDEGRVVLVHDLPIGRSLRAALRLGTPLTLEERIRVLADICRGLAHAHAHDVIHRRIEPSRVLIGDDGVARLDGFGWARLLVAGAHTVWAQAAIEDMEPEYVAPEIVNPGRGPIGPATDLYGLGCIGYALLAGQPPQPGGDNDGLPSLPSEAPVVLRELLPQLVSSDLSHRAADTPGVLRVLEDLLSTTGSSAPPSPSSEGGYGVGSLIDGRFEIRGKLGRGGFSHVFRVYDPVMDEEFALKIFEHQGDYEKLRREIQVLRNLPKHQHLVSAVWADRTDLGHWYLVSELIEGEPLSEFVTGERSLAPQETIEAVIQILSALEAIHPNQRRIEELTAKDSLTSEELAELQELKDTGIVHRDIKPQNIILAPGRGAVVIDFNIASGAGDTQATLSGTPPYMPPDIGFAKWTADVDLFAAGVVLYELLCGVHPYPDEQPSLQAIPIDPLMRRPDLAPELAQLLRRACAPLEADRFRTAAEFLSALAAIAQPVVPVTAGNQHLPSELTALLQGASPNTNPFVMEFLALGSQARRTTIGTRGLTALAEATYVETRLDEELADAVLEGRHALVVITGNAGDGKTAFIQRVEQRARERNGHVTPRLGGSTIEYADTTVTTLYDGSQDERERTSDEVLREFFLPFASGAGERDEVRMAAINEGRLRDFVMAFRAEFPRLIELLEQVDDPNAAVGVSDLIVVNLNARSVTTGGEMSIFSRQIARIVDNAAFWVPCEACDFRARCPLKHNVDSLRDKTAGPILIERLRRLVDIVRLRRRRHLTMRDVRSLISFLLFRDRYCDEVPRLLEADDPIERIDLAYFQGIAGLGVPEGSAVDRGATLLAEVDVGNVVNPDLDRALADGLGPRVMRFEARDSEWPAELIQEARRRAGRGYDAVVEASREVHAADRRRVFFERSDEGWQRMLPYRRLLDFERALVPEAASERAELATDVLQAISISNGISDASRLSYGLWLATAEVDPGIFPSYRRFPVEDFELRAIAQSAPYMETQPEILDLVHLPTGIDLRLDLDLLETLQRLQEGYMPSPEEARGLLVNLTLFQNRLLSLPTAELVVCADDGDVRIEPGSTPSSVALVEATI
jgi:serine/threonine protein kinase